MKIDEAFHKLNQENYGDCWDRPCNNIMGASKQ